MVGRPHSSASKCCNGLGDPMVSTPMSLYLDATSLTGFCSTKGWQVNCTLMSSGLLKPSLIAISETCLFSVAAAKKWCSIITTRASLRSGFLEALVVHIPLSWTRFRCRCEAILANHTKSLSTFPPRVMYLVSNCASLRRPDSDHLWTVVCTKDFLLRNSSQMWTLRSLSDTSNTTQRAGTKSASKVMFWDGIFLSHQSWGAALYFKGKSLSSHTGIAVHSILKIQKEITISF